MRKALALATAALLLASLAGCSSSDDGGGITTPYDFNGTWNFTMTLVEDPQGWWTADTGHALNSSWTHAMVGVQNGTTLTFYDQTESQFTYTGTCDPSTGTFNVAYLIGTVDLRYTGIASDDSTMAGEFNGYHGPDNAYPNGKTTRQTWTATLVAR